MFHNKRVLLTGGTGSFGNAFIQRFQDSDIQQIIVFSRDEKKQDAMRLHYKNPKLKFALGNIRDRDAVDDVCRNVDYIFHAAALKQVPSCDFSPIEASKTNIFGTDNLIRAAIRNHVKKVTFLSTGKAVHPINAMGISKAMMEKVILQRVRDIEEDGLDTILTFIRYSNVFASRGSAVNTFIKQIKEKKPITLTHPDMIRSVMSVDEALDLALFAMEKGENGDLFIYKSKRTNLAFLASSLQEIYQAENREIQIIGKRHGEKLEETILTQDELLRMKDLGDYVCVPADKRGLYIDTNIAENRRDLDNHNAKKITPITFPTLTIEDLKALLKNIPQEF